MKKMNLIPALLVAFSAQSFTTSAFATPITQHNAWDIKQPLAQSFARSVLVKLNDADGLGLRRHSAANVEFNFFTDSLFSLNEGVVNTIRSGELQHFVVSAVNDYVAEAKTQSADTSANSELAAMVAAESTVTNVPTTSMPEPGSLALLAAGLAGMVVVRHRAKANS